LKSTIFKAQNSSQILPFFILGHPRSGTTALARILNSSSLVTCLFYESNVLMRLWQTLRRSDVLSEPHDDLIIDFNVSARYALYERPTALSSHGIIFPQTALAELSQSYKEALGCLLEPASIFDHVLTTFFKILAEISGSNIVGDKVPDYSLIPEVITSPLPSCKLIIISRDLRETTHSTLALNRRTLHLFASPDIFATACSFALREKKLQEFLKDFPDQRKILLNHQELLTAPRKSMMSVISFIGVDQPDQKMLAYIKQIENSPPKIKNWRLELPIKEQAAIEAVFSVFGILSQAQRLTSPDEQLEEIARIIHAITICCGRQLRSVIQNAHKIFSEMGRRTSLGHCLLKLADFTHSQKATQHQHTSILFEAALHNIPLCPIAWYKYGAYCFDIKQITECKKALLQAVENCSRHNYYRILRAKALFLLGRIEDLYGSRSKAKDYYRNSLKSFIGFRLAQAMLSK